MSSLKEDVREFIDDVLRAAVPTFGKIMYPDHQSMNERARELLRRLDMENMK